MEQNQVERQEVPQEVFERFDAYDFAHDEDYQVGMDTPLSACSQSTERPRNNLVERQADLKGHYIDGKDLLLHKVREFDSGRRISDEIRKVEPIDYDNYKAWKAPVRPLSDADIDEAMRTQSNPTAIGLGSADATPPVIVSGPSISNDPDMPYPASFADIVEMIKSGKPVPGTLVDD